MLSKHVIKEVIEWKTSRTFFYWRLRRLLAQVNTVKRILEKPDNQLTYDKALGILKSWFDEFTNKTKNWNNNELVAIWLESELSDEESFVNKKLKNLKHDNILNQIKTIIENHPDIALESIGYLVESTPTEKIKQVIQLLTDKVVNASLMENKNGEALSGKKEAIDDNLASKSSGPSTDVSFASATATKQKETVKQSANSNSSSGTKNSNKK